MRMNYGCIHFIRTNSSPRYTLAAARLTARHAVHMQFDISANALRIRAEQSLKCLMISTKIHHKWVSGLTMNMPLHIHGQTTDGTFTLYNNEYGFY
jgi:hypothetical protein